MRSKSSSALKRRTKPAMLLALGTLTALSGAPAGGATMLVGTPLTNAYANAHIARTVRVADTAHLHQVRRPGSLIVEEGRASGSIPGTVKAYINLGATIIVKVTIYPTGGGSIVCHGSGELKGRPAEPSFGGRLTITSGTGRYAHAHGGGGLYGVLVRRTLAATVSATGTLTY